MALGIPRVPQTTRSGVASRAQRVRQGWERLGSAQEPGAWRVDAVVWRSSSPSRLSDPRASPRLRSARLEQTHLVYSLGDRHTRLADLAAGRGNRGPLWARNQVARIA